MFGGGVWATLQRRPDIGRARALLDWAPVTPLHAGLRRTIEYFEALLTARGHRPSPAVSHALSPQARALR